jgi:hypothetical protein
VPCLFQPERESDRVRQCDHHGKDSAPWREEVSGLMRLAILIFAASLLGFQGHEGQPDVCHNRKIAKHPCACQRATTCAQDRDEEEDRKCQTYCRKPACKCIDPCETRRFPRSGISESARLYDGGLPLIQGAS